jgi:uncharacterized protein
MFKNFLPSLFIKKVQDIELGFLEGRNIKGLILDIDNTLVPSYIKEADDAVVEWIENVKKRGFKVCIVSNASKSRVIEFNKRLRLFAIHRATKPGTRSFKKAMKIMELGSKEIAVVGDQIFTDIYGGNRIGMYTILVKPIHEAESFFVKLKRYPERYILKKYKESIGMG